MATNILFSAGARYVMERLFLRTRLREAMLFLLVVVGIGAAGPAVHEREEVSGCFVSRLRRSSGRGRRSRG